MADATLMMHETVVALTPETEAARRWIEANVSPDRDAWFGNSLNLTYEAINDIIFGMREAGLKVETRPRNR